MPTVEPSIDVNVSVTTAYNQWTQFEEFPSFMVTFHRIDENTTRLMVQIDWEIEGMMDQLGSAVGADDRRVKSDLERFKEMIEARGQETGTWRGEVEQGDVAQR
jgi:uncharacterized membrane protein